MRHTTDTNLEIAKWLGGAAAGALLMYLLDPDRGGARRARSAAAVREVGARTSGALGNAWHGAGARLGEVGERLRGKAHDAAAFADGALADGAAPLGRAAHAAGAALDDTLARARNGAARAGALADEGADAARGAVRQGAAAARAALDRAADATDEAVRGARGFGARARAAMQPGPEGAWAPGMRNSALAGGTLLAVLGLMRRSPIGLALGVAGALLLARGAANQPLGGMLRTRAMHMDQTVDVERSVHIDATPEDVYDLWTDYENFPRFMSHVVAVRDLGRRRSHWVVRGPGGSEYAWNSVLTEQNRPQRLAWRSEPGAEIPQSGSVQFEPQRGGTLVTVRISYTPPAGAVGRGLASLLGADPQSRLEDDLAHMKAYVERGRPPLDAGRAHAGSRYLH